ncbi:MAG: hypothetical protein IH897_07550 [Planctomycetes bacterium]|nr:hypothetical protein [Planctomycetota bacterium]
MKREVAEPLIAERLSQRPHDTAAEVAAAVGCSVGVVVESTAWKLNRKRLKIAKREGIDPKAVKLTEAAVNAAGGGKMRQLHDHRQKAAAIDDQIDEGDRELARRIKEYQRDNPHATTQQVAGALGCSSGDVERRQATLDGLVAEQSADHLEDVDVEDPTTQSGTRRKWTPKRV